MIRLLARERPIVPKIALTGLITPLATSALYSSIMSSLSVNFAKALSRGRINPPLPDTRERLLVTLLRKRAAAQNAGADELESLLRAQILWALPTQCGEERQLEAA